MSAERTQHVLEPGLLNERFLLQEPLTVFHWQDPQGLLRLYFMEFPLNPNLSLAVCGPTFGSTEANMRARIAREFEYLGVKALLGELTLQERNNYANLQSAIKFAS